MFSRSGTNLAKVLVVNSTLNGANGNSRALTKAFVEQLQEKRSGDEFVYRDLHEDGLPHLSAAEMGAWMAAADKRTDEQKKLVAISDKLIEELKAADVVVLGIPMYNFQVPSSFKAWMDRLARAGITFKYTATGSVGLLEGKKVYALFARGGIYQGTGNDHQTAWVKQILGFMGMTDVECAHAEGYAMGPEAAQKATASGDEQIKKIISSM
ncbi:FMN-dependent NADH-azoreductase [Diplonema papillatum]|nr:FMN-dependent NADH-azoreductase [Diplonema papillatum]|eukprot:gene11251-17309_t